MKNSVNVSKDIPECTRCEAMFRSIELYEAHRKVCCGGKVSLCRKCLIK